MFFAKPVPLRHCFSDDCRSSGTSHSSGTANTHAHSDAIGNDNSHRLPECAAIKENEQPLSGLRRAEAALLKRLGFITVRGRMLPLARHSLGGQAASLIEPSSSS